MQRAAFCPTLSLCLSPLPRDRERRWALGVLEDEMRQRGSAAAAVDLERLDEGAFILWLQVGRHEHCVRVPRGLEEEALRRLGRAAFAQLAVQLVRAWPAGGRRAGGCAA